LEVKAAVSEDGRYLCMEPVQQTFFGFLYEYAGEISDLLFNSEDVVGNNIMAGGGWIVSTASGELENLIPGNIGRTQDYADLFTDYLKDNEVYLNTYQIEENQDIKYVKDVAKTAGTLENIFGATAEALTPLYNIMLKEAVDPDFYKSYFKPAKALSFGIEVISSACEYAYAYANQVEDHRKMLYAVYDYKADTGWPSYKAAMNIAKIYDEDADKSMELFAKTTVDVSSGAISDAILGKVYGPWFAAMEITKAFCAEEYEYVVKSGSINLVSNTVQYAYRMFQSRFCNNELGGSSLNDMRLCLMMSLVGSRHAYKTYWGSSRQDDVDAIDKMLKQLYLAGKWEDTEATSTYILQKDKFRKDLPKLQTVKDDPVSVAELGLLTTAMMKDYYADFHYAPFDTDDDGVDELEISYFLKHQGKNVYIRIDFNEPNMEYIVTSIDSTLAGVQEEKNTYTVWGVGKDMLAELDSHFAKRAGLMYCLKCDLEDDGDEDRIYCFYGAAKQYDRSQEDSNVVFWDEGMTVMVAQNDGDSIDLRFFKDEYRNLVQLDAYYPNVQDHLGADSCTYGDGVLTVDGFAYEYQKSGVPFKALGSADLGTIEQYLTMEKDLWDYSEADLTHPYDSDPEYTKGTVKGMSVSHNAVWVDERRKLNYFYLKPDGAEMFIEEGVSTNSTPNSLLEALSTVVDWDYSTALKKGQREGGLMGPYPIPAGDGEIYESSLLWQLPNGDIYMILMITEDDSPDSPILELTFHLV